MIASIPYAAYISGFILTVAFVMLILTGFRHTFQSNDRNVLIALIKAYNLLTGICAVFALYFWTSNNGFALIGAALSLWLVSHLVLTGDKVDWRAEVILKRAVKVAPVAALLILILKFF